MNIGQEMFTTFNDDPDLLKKVITGDKVSVYGYDIETKAQLSRFATIEEIKEKSKCFVDWKNASISVLYLRAVTLKGTR